MEENRKLQDERSEFERFRKSEEEKVRRRDRQIQQLKEENNRKGEVDRTNIIKFLESYCPDKAEDIRKEFDRMNKGEVDSDSDEGRNIMSKANQAMAVAASVANSAQKQTSWANQLRNLLHTPAPAPPTVPTTVAASGGGYRASLIPNYSTSSFSNVHSSQQLAPGTAPHTVAASGGGKRDRDTSSGPLSTVSATGSGGWVGPAAMNHQLDPRLSDLLHQASSQNLDYMERPGSSSYKQYEHCSANVSAVNASLKRQRL